MRLPRPILLALLLSLCVLLSAATPTDKVFPTKATPLSFTLETKDKVVGLLQPLTIRVVLHNNSQSSLSLDTRTLRIDPDGWHVVDGGGQWSGPGEGFPLAVEDKPSGKIELAPGASLRLLFVHKNPTFELLGPTRVYYKLRSLNAATNKLLPADACELSLHIPPTKLMTSVWAAESQADREQSQTAFKEFLRFWAKTEAADPDEDANDTDETVETDFEQRIADRNLAAKTLFYLAGYALPFLTDATRDKDPFIRAQAVLAYPYAAGAIEQFDAYLDGLDALGPRPQWASNLKKGHNNDQADWRAFALRALSDPAAGVRLAGVTVLTKKYWSESNADFLPISIGTPKNDAEQESDDGAKAADEREQTLRELEAVKALAKDADASVRAAVQEFLKSFVDQSTGADIIADAVNDPDPTVRKKALDALLRSSDPPLLEALNRAFAQAKGDTALSLLQLLLEQENSTLSAVVGKDFARRSEAERFAIMTAIAGHTDSAAVELIKSGLSDPAATVQGVALMRLLALPGNISIPLLDYYLHRAPSELKTVAVAIKTEIEMRRLWPFLKTASTNQTAASESTFSLA